MLANARDYSSSDQYDKVRDETKKIVRYINEYRIKNQKLVDKVGFPVNRTIGIVGVALIQPLEIVQARLQTHTARGLLNNSFDPKQGIAKENFQQFINNKALKECFEDLHRCYLYQWSLISLNQGFAKENQN